MGKDWQRERWCVLQFGKEIEENKREGVAALGWD
jgi:hypothetical protein